MPFRNPERPKGPFRNGPKGHLKDGDPEMADAFPKWRYFINTVALYNHFEFSNCPLRIPLPIGGQLERT